MDEIKDLLTNKAPSEPPQVAAIKKYAKDKYDTPVRVRVSPKHYLVTIPNAALAQRMREDTLDITEVCNLDKRLVIHIGV